MAVVDLNKDFSFASGYSSRSYFDSRSSATASSVDIHVRIGAMINAGTFWVSQGPSDSTLWKKVSEHESKLRMIFESDFLQEYNCSRADLEPGALVAVRPSPTSKFWYRAKVCNSSSYLTGLHVRVFLVDYGDFLPSLKVASCVRKLPKDLTGPNWIPQMAFIFQLKGLVPILELEERRVLDGQEKVEFMMCEHWHTKANRLVQSYLSKSDPKELLISDWTHDQEKGILSGSALVLDSKNQFSLGNVLIDHQMAVLDIDEALDTSSTLSLTSRKVLRCTNAVLAVKDDSILQLPSYIKLSGKAPLSVVGSENGSADSICTATSTLSEASSISIPAGIDIGLDRENRVSKAAIDEDNDKEDLQTSRRGCESSNSSFFQDDNEWD